MKPKFILVTMMFFLVTCLQAHTDLHAQTVGGGGTIYQCSNQPLPSGYVVVASGTDYRCTGIGVYYWTAEAAYNGITACLGSSYPSPYFITGESSNAYQCTNGGFLGAMTLTLPYNGLVACVNGVLWSPWVITANGSSTLCNGYAAITLSQPINGLRICSNSIIPAGWYTSSPSQFYICKPYMAETLYKQTAASTQQTNATGYYEQAGKTAIIMLDKKT